MERHYFDWAATSPPDTDLIQKAIETSISTWGNPSSRHAEGKAAAKLLRETRLHCASVLSVPPETLFFTSGGTESNNLVLESLLLRPSKPALLVSAVEHPSILEAAQLLKRQGHGLAIAPVGKDGIVEPLRFSALLEKEKGLRLASVMAVNNETGAIQPVQRLVEECRRFSAAGNPAIHFHTDCVQAAGKIPLDLTRWDVDSASISAHKLGGPRGIGLLYLKKPIDTLSSGGGQEGGRRSGTENLFGALALASVLERHASGEALEKEMQSAMSRMDHLIGSLSTMERAVLVPSDRRAGDSRYSPFILQAAFKGVPAEILVRLLSDRGFSISTGSACAASEKRRPILDAMGISESTAFEAVRFSQGWSTTPADIQALEAALSDLLTTI